MLNGKVALITGGGSGMGRSTALELARNRAKVIVIGRTEEKLIETVKLANEENLLLHYKMCDVSDPNAISSIFNELVVAGKCPDIVVNCAGVINVKKSNGMLNDDVVFAVNTRGLINVCDEAIQSMLL